MKIRQADLANPGPVQDRLLAALHPHVPSAAPWVHVGGYLGRSVVLRSAELVVKCFFHAAESKWRRELRAYSFLSGSSLPVPRVIASGHLDEVPWLLMTAVPGSIGSDVVADIGEPVRSQLFAAAGTLLAQLHSLAVDERLTDRPAAVAADAYLNRLARRLGEYGARAGAHGRGLAVARSWAVDLLRTYPAELVCTHGDFSMRNLLVERDGGGWELTGLIDFERCEAGDRAVDLVRMLVAHPDWETPPVRAFLDAYASRSTLPTRERVLVQLAAIVLDVATWAPQHDPAYYRSLVDLVERIDADDDRLPSVFPRASRAAAAP